MNDLDQPRNGESQFARLALAGQHHAQKAQQRDEASGQSVNEEFSRGIAALRPAPDADQEKERYQRQFKKDVKENDVKGHEDAQHAGLQEQQPSVKLIDALLDSGP